MNTHACRREADFRLEQIPDWGYALLPCHSSLSVVSLSFYEITPLDVWFRSCPPRGGGGGRLWSERIGPHPAFPQAAVESYEIAQRSADQIIQVRHDKNGAVVRTTFSLQACGNVVDDKYYPPGSSNPSIHYIYLWQTHPRGPCTLRSLTITDATTSKGDSFDTRYSLEVDKVTIEPPPDASFFTEQSFFRRLPPNTVIEDHVASGSTM